MHALIRDGQIVTLYPLSFDPQRGTVWWGGDRWYDFRDNEALAASLGWAGVVYLDRPADTATTTWERTDPALIDGLPIIGWTEVPKSPEWIAAEEAAAAHEADRLLVRAIITDLQAEKARAQVIIDAADSTKHEKNAARAAKRIADAAIDLARFVKDA